MTYAAGSSSIRLHKTTLAIGMLITLVASLSVHLVMLQVLGISFPEFAGIKPWVPFLNLWLTVLSLIVFCDLARPRLRRFHLTVQCVIVFVLFAMLKESIRGMFMSGFVTGDWIFSIVSGLPGLTSTLILASLIVLIAPQLQATWIKVTVAAAIAALVSFAVRPLLHTAFAPILKATTPLNHADLFAFPYGWHVLVWAYVTYAEPVVAAVFISALVWQSLSSRAGIRILQFALLIVLMRGMLLPTFLYSFYSKLPLPSAMLSQSQFLFETAVLGLLVAITWQASTAVSLSNDPKKQIPEPLGGNVRLDAALR